LNLFQISELQSTWAGKYCRAPPSLLRYKDSTAPLASSFSSPCKHSANAIVAGFSSSPVTGRFALVLPELADLPEPPQVGRNRAFPCRHPVRHRRSVNIARRPPSPQSTRASRSPTSSVATGPSEDNRRPPKLLTAGILGHPNCAATANFD
jgi:hypothetical protein